MTPSTVSTMPEKALIDTGIIRRRPLIPYVSDLEDLTLEEGDIVRNISMNIRFYEGWDE